jgi:hypothetical protein
MDRMAVISTYAIQKARDRVARSAYLMDRQEAIICTLERWGADTRLACALLYTMYRSRLLMIEYLDHLKRVEGAASASAASDSAASDATPSDFTASDFTASERAVPETGVDEHPHASLDEWLQLLTLALNPHQGPHGPH